MQKGSFVVRHTHRKFSAVPLDQALEKEYNKVAKGKGGVIEYSKQKGTVAKWNLINQEKLRHVRWLNELCGLMVDDEYSLHHEFSNATTKEDIESVESIKKYAASHQDPFDTSLTKNITNIVTAEMLQNFKIEYLLNSVEQGETLYKQFVETRLIEHSKSLFDTLTKRNKKGSVSSSDEPVDIQNENVKALKYIDIARTRDFDVEELLTYELSKQPR